MCCLSACWRALMQYVCLNRRSDVVALVLDASECADTDAERFVITQQDFRCDFRPHAQHSPAIPGTSVGVKQVAHVYVRIVKMQSAFRTFMHF